MTRYTKKDSEAPQGVRAVRPRRHGRVFVTEFGEDVNCPGTLRRLYERREGVMVGVAVMCDVCGAVLLDEETKGRLQERRDQLLESAWFNEPDFAPVAPGRRSAASKSLARRGRRQNR